MIYDDQLSTDEEDIIKVNHIELTSRTRTEAFGNTNQVLKWEDRELLTSSVRLPALLVEDSKQLFFKPGSSSSPTSFFRKL